MFLTVEDNHVWVDSMCAATLVWAIGILVTRDTHHVGVLRVVLYACAARQSLIGQQGRSDAYAMDRGPQVQSSIVTPPMAAPSSGLLANRA